MVYDFSNKVDYCYFYMAYLTAEGLFGCALNWGYLNSHPALAVKKREKTEMSKQT
jgi:hypothetical protein